MNENSGSREGNTDRPTRAYLRGEVKVIFVILVSWVVTTFGFQILLWLLAATPEGEGFLTRFTFFNLPFHFWFTGQFVPLWFIILCIIFNIYMDRLTGRHSRRRDRFHE